jgi:dimethylamine/trimethylamine dehydrogenase
MTIPQGRDPRYDVLFEPVAIGPVVARNRFFQVPQCNGMGYRDPSALAAMRGIKAEGGWAVVSTEETEIHASSEFAPYIQGRIWDDRDIPAHARVTESIHAHGSLAAIELTHNGSPNLYTRIPPMGPSHRPVHGEIQPIQIRRMDRSDVADLRQWHREAVERSIEAGYDVIYVYAGHDFSTLNHFLSRQHNDRTDEYGGSLENRARLLREILEDTREIADGRAGVACRINVDELVGDRGINREETVGILEMLGEIPDMWDFMVGGWPDDSNTSRFGPEAEREDYIRGLKDLTAKPVVGVGRFTSPDTMVRMIRQGILDFIGAARPSIADPFLPKKIEEGRIEDIRECIGCNICVASDTTMAPIRCTQNPTMGEEWRKGWHPEIIRPKHSDAKILVVGGGPAGLEAAMALGNRGYEVVLIEASMTADEILEYGFDHIAIATGATWRRDGIGYAHTQPLDLDPEFEILTPDDLIAGTRPSGKEVVIFDDDHYYMGGVLAELLLKEDYSVTLVTPAADVSTWTHNTMEQHRIQARLLNLGAKLITGHTVVATDTNGVVLACVYTDREQHLDCDAAVFVTSRLPNEGLYLNLLEQRPSWNDAGLLTVRAVGDALNPGTIASAVWDGRRFAEELGRADEDRPFPREIARLSP